MGKSLPEEIENGVELLEKAFGCNDHFERIRTFKDAVYILNDCSREFPLYTNDIDDLRFTNTVRLLCGIETGLPDPDYRIWLEYTLLFCIDLKPEIKQIYTKDPTLFESFLSFVSGYSDEISPELKKNIDGFLNEIMS